MKPENNGLNRDKCICPTCRVFTSCNAEKDEKLFCARTKSVCAMNTNQACICSMCPVYNDNDLSGGYFCLTELEK